MAEYEEDDDQLPSVDHGPLNEGPWEKCLYIRKHFSLTRASGDIYGQINKHLLENKCFFHR